MFKSETANRGSFTFENLCWGFPLTMENLLCLEYLVQKLNYGCSKYKELKYILLFTIKDCAIGLSQTWQKNKNCQTDRQLLI